MQTTGHKKHTWLRRTLRVAVGLALVAITGLAIAVGVAFLIRVDHHGAYQKKLQTFVDVTQRRVEAHLPAGMAPVEYLKSIGDGGMRATTLAELAESVSTLRQAAESTGDESVQGFREIFQDWGRLGMVGLRVFPAAAEKPSPIAASTLEGLMPIELLSEPDALAIAVMSAAPDGWDSADAKEEVVAHWHIDSALSLLQLHSLWYFKRGERKRGEEFHFATTRLVCRMVPVGCTGATTVMQCREEQLTFTTGLHECGLLSPEAVKKTLQHLFLNPPKLQHVIPGQAAEDLLSVREHLNNVREHESLQFSIFSAFRDTQLAADFLDELDEAMAIEDGFFSAGSQPNGFQHLYTDRGGMPIDLSSATELPCSGTHLSQHNHLVGFHGRLLELLISEARMGTLLAAAVGSSDYGMGLENPLQLNRAVSDVWQLVMAVDGLSRKSVVSRSLAVEHYGRSRHILLLRGIAGTHGDASDGHLSEIAVSPNEAMAIAKALPELAPRKGETKADSRWIGLSTWTTVGGELSPIDLASIPGLLSSSIVAIGATQLATDASLICEWTIVR